MSTTKKIVLLPGDGIGPEVTEQAIKVSREAAKLNDIELETEEYTVGGKSIDENGVPVTDEAMEACKKADAVFLGAVGGPKWDNVDKSIRPEAALLRLRNELGLFTNLRPIKVFDALVGASSLKKEIVKDIDLMVVRELTGGIYFGEPRKTVQIGEQEEEATDSLVYRTSEIKRITEAAFDVARKRNRSKKVTSVDKSNILDTSRLWRKTVTEMAETNTDIELEHMLVDNCAMQLVRYPAQFDVIVTGNMFGDILSDEAAMITGSIGMLPSASLGTGTAMYEPVHGSAPDIAGSGKANPLAAIGSAAMMFRYSFNAPEAADAIESAVEQVLNDGLRTVDLQSESSETHVATTEEMTQQILTKIAKKKENHANA